MPTEMLMSYTDLTVFLSFQFLAVADFSFKGLRWISFSTFLPMTADVDSPQSVPPTPESLKDVQMVTPKKQPTRPDGKPGLLFTPPHKIRGPRSPAHVCASTPSSGQSSETSDSQITLLLGEPTPKKRRGEDKKIMKTGDDKNHATSDASGMAPTKKMQKYQKDQNQQKLEKQWRDHSELAIDLEKHEKHPKRLV